MQKYIYREVLLYTKDFLLLLHHYFRAAIYYVVTC